MFLLGGRADTSAHARPTPGPSQGLREAAGGRRGARGGGAHGPRAQGGLCAAVSPHAARTASGLHAETRGHGGFKACVRMCAKFQYRCMYTHTHTRIYSARMENREIRRKNTPMLFPLHLTRSPGGINLSETHYSYSVSSPALTSPRRSVFIITVNF